MTHVHTVSRFMWVSKIRRLGALIGTSTVRVKFANPLPVCTVRLEAQKFVTSIFPSRPPEYGLLHHQVCIIALLEGE